jgi:hypothetical protein
MVSVHPVLKASSWRVSVLIQTERRIDRRYPLSDRRIIRCYCLRFFSATRPTLLENGSSVHLTVPWFSPCVLTRPTIASMLAIYVPSIHLTVSFLFLFFLVFDSWKIYYLLNLACGILASLGPRNVYKDMLNNMVSSIDHVVMNYQNQTRTNGIWGHVCYTFTLLHREEFSKSCTSNISGVLLQKLMETLIRQVTQAYTRLFSTYSTHIWKWKAFVELGR